MKLKIGICGCGSITKYRHAPEYADNAYAEIAGFYDPVRERAEDLSKEFGGIVYESAEAMLNDKKLDAVSICSANKYHFEQVITALKAGKHVLCEKPMTTSLEKAGLIVKTAAESGKKLMIAENFRTAPAHIKAKDLITSGAIGRIHTFRAVFGHPGPEYWTADQSTNTWFFRKDESSVGCTGDLGIHKIDMLRWLFSDEVEEVSANIATLEKKNKDGTPIDVEDNAVAILKFRSGIFGTLTSSWTYKGAEDHSTVIYGSEGTLKIYDHPDYAVVVSREDGEKAFYDVGKIPTNDGQFKTGIIDMFMDCVVNETGPIVTGNDGLEDLKVALNILKAAETKTVIKNI